MSNPIAQAGKRGLTDPNKPSGRNKCQKYVRLCATDVVGHRFDTWLWQDTAREAALALLKGGLAFRVGDVAAHGGLQSGDILYKTTGSGGAGHVGIYDDPQHIYENSSYHAARNPNGDARGVRTLAQFGHFDVVARLPIPEAAPPKPPQSHPLKVLLNGVEIKGATIANGTMTAPVRDVLEALEMEVALSDNRATDGKVLLSAYRKQD